jgi:O-antigen/teichoic acid export membrane protein
VTHRLSYNAIANASAFLFAAGVGFFLSPYLVAHLGPTRYGVWSLTVGMVGYLGLLDLGIRQGVSRYTARHHATGAHEESSLVVSAALRLFGFFGLLVILLSAALAWFALQLFNIPAELVGDARIIIVLLGCSIAVALVGGVFGGIVTGLERFDIQCGLDILVTSVRTVAIVLALRQGYGLVALAFIQLSGSVLECVVYAIAARKLYKQLRIRLWAALGPHIRTMLKFGSSLSLLYLLSKIIYYSDTAVIGAFLPIEAVTFFVIAGSLCVYAKELSKALGSLMTPRVSALTSVGGSQVGDLILAVTKTATLVSTSIAVTFVLRGESFIALWMGPAYGKVSGQVLQILAIVVWLDALRSVAIYSLTGMARQSMIIPGVVVEAVANLALSLALVQRLGIVGVALGTLIPNVLVSLAYFPRRLSSATAVRVGLIYKHALVLPTLACVPFAVATQLIERVFPAPNLAIFFLQVLVSVPLVPLTAWFVCLSEPQKQQARSAMRMLVGGRTT